MCPSCLQSLWIFKCSEEGQAGNPEEGNACVRDGALTVLQSESHCQLSEVFTPFTKYFGLCLILPVA